MLAPKAIVRTSLSCHSTSIKPGCTHGFVSPPTSPFSGVARRNLRASWPSESRANTPTGTRPRLAHNSLARRPVRLRQSAPIRRQQPEANYAQC